MNTPQFILVGILVALSAIIITLFWATRRPGDRDIVLLLALLALAASGLSATLLGGDALRSILKLMILLSALLAILRFYGRDDHESG
jgi:hypothetical protein